MAATLALTAARRLAPALIAREPLAEVSALIEACLAPLRDVPHLVVRLTDTLAEPVSEHVAALVERQGFAGRLVVLGDPEIAPGDCRIEWADGGLTRERAAIEAEIDQHVSEFLQARGGPAFAEADPAAALSDMNTTDETQLAESDDG